jgi:hypothetical protein
MDNRSYLFEDFKEELWPHLMVALQESILFQFGFISCPVDPQTHSGYGNTRVVVQQQPSRHHYVHSSGNMFVLIPATNMTNQGIGIKSSPKFAVSKSQDSPVASSYEDYITRHVSVKSKDPFHEETRVGYLWSWNYMVSKRWKTSSTPALGDDGFFMKILRDFQAFCNNENNRLRHYWHQFCSTKQNLKK